MDPDNVQQSGHGPNSNRSPREQRRSERLLHTLAEERRKKMAEGKWKFDPTLNVGHVIILAGFVFSTLASYFAITNRLDTFEIRLQTQEANGKSQVEVNGKILDSVNRLNLELAVLNARQEKEH